MLLCSLNVLSHIYKKITRFLWKVGSYVKVEGELSYFLLWLQSSITGSCTPPFNKKDGKTFLCFSHVYQCPVCLYVFVCVIYSGVLLKKSVISDSAEMDETLGSHSHYFEESISHCCDAENLIMLVATNKCSDGVCDIISSHVRK